MLLLFLALLVVVMFIWLRVTFWCLESLWLCVVCVCAVCMVGFDVVFVVEHVVLDVVIVVTCCCCVVVAHGELLVVKWWFWVGSLFSLPLQWDCFDHNSFVFEAKIMGLGVLESL